MRLVPTNLRVLLAAIILIAGGAIAGIGPGLAGPSVVGEVLTGFGRDSGGATRHIEATGQDRHHNDCSQGCGMDCLHSAGAGCCTANVPTTSDCRIFDRVLVAVHGIMEAGSRAPGIDPEALLQPPQIVA